MCQDCSVAKAGLQTRRQKILLDDSIRVSSLEESPVVPGASMGPTFGALWSQPYTYPKDFRLESRLRSSHAVHGPGEDGGRASVLQREGLASPGQDASCDIAAASWISICL